MMADMARGGMGCTRMWGTRMHMFACVSPCFSSSTAPDDISFLLRQATSSTRQHIINIPDAVETPRGAASPHMSPSTAAAAKHHLQFPNHAANHASLFTPPAVSRCGCTAMEVNAACEIHAALAQAMNLNVTRVLVTEYQDTDGDST